MDPPPPRAPSERPISSPAGMAIASKRASCLIYPYGYLISQGYLPGLRPRKYR